MKTPLLVAALITSSLLITAGCSRNNDLTEGQETHEKQEQGLVDTEMGTPPQRTNERKALPQEATLSSNTAPVQTKSAGVTAYADAVAPRGGLPAPAAEQSVPVSGNPKMNFESYNGISENRFHNSLHTPLSTFSIDVDTASYANVRRFIRNNALPPVGAVRIEEMINYFHYNYDAPADGPLAIHLEAGPSPFHKEYKLVSIGLQGRDVEKASLPPSNLVFLIDVSGSMRAANKLPLLKKSIKMLVDQLGTRDRIAMVVYAGSDRVVLEPTSGSQKQRIYEAIDRLASGGSTHGSQGIVTAYRLAEQSLMPQGNNRIILASDGDFNVGLTSRGELQKLIEDKRQSGIYLSVLGFGMGNYHDDTMELLADKGNGNYAYIDTLLEAKKVMVKQMSGTLYTLAGDVKIQVEFNPARVGAYRLIGYENRMLAAEDFRDDTKDAGEVGVGHQVTALYEIIPAGHRDVPAMDTLKYQKPRSNSGGDGELLTVKLRYKPLHSDTSKLHVKTLATSASELSRTSDDFRFAAAVAGFGMHLRRSSHIGETDLARLLDLARTARGTDADGFRAECIRLMEMTELLAM